MSNVGEETTRNVVSAFTVEKDLDVQTWFREKALAYEKSGNARTFLFLSESLEVVAMFSLALNVFTIPEKCSRRLRDDLTGYGHKMHKVVPCFLLGQFARDDSHSNLEISGKEMFIVVLEKIQKAREIVGGRFLMVDCKDSMIPYYEKLGFEFADKSPIKEGLNQMFLML